MANLNATCQDFTLSGVVCYGVFYNYQNQTNNPLGVNCTSIDNFDPDVAGIGVVISFTASCVITTLASIGASVLDYIAGTDQPLLPRRWQPVNVSQPLRDRCLFARRILDRLILDFADQQLVTGFALLISAWVKLHTNASLEVLESIVPGSKASALRFPNYALPTAEFSLIVFLCMASSSSHLASILVLREYMEGHRSSARLRIMLMTVFAAFLAVTIALASSLTTYFAWVIVKIFSIAYRPKATDYPPWVSVLILALSIAVPLLVVLGVFWVSSLQLSPRLKGAVQRKVKVTILGRLRRWFRLSKIWHSGLMRLLPQRWRDPITKFTKRVFWFLILGNESAVFTFQIVLAILSIIWISLQRLSTPPEFWTDAPVNSTSTEIVKKRFSLCSLHNVAGKGEIASFGQLLPLIFLVLPLFTAYGSYIVAEEKDRRRELDERHVSGYTFIVDPQHSPHVPRVPVRKERQSPYTDDSELSLLDPSGRRHDSEGRDSSTSHPPRRTYARQNSQRDGVGMGIRYDQGWSPPGQTSSTTWFDLTQSSSTGWPSGYSTGTGEGYQSRPGARQ